MYDMCLGITYLGNTCVPTITYSDSKMYMTKFNLLTLFRLIVSLNAFTLLGN